ncbi:MAG: NADPH dehydrogenase NamA [Clostridiales Family XIII bacterium]|jgi:NADPH2 dehydrogenase|nr:NADPH dehydrogenase NamA [Clostridiales Family XIII bacterium]
MLFNELTLRDMTLKNRIVMAPMCMYAAGNDAKATDWHQIHYGSRALGGVALIVQEATAISPEGRITSNDLGIYDDSHAAGLKTLVDTVHSMGAKAGIQLAHAGRKCEADVPHIYAPSAIAYNEKAPEPVEMDDVYIKKTVRDFQAGAKRALEAGYDIVQVHAAHGYLLNEFLSPVTNKRTDAYGGSPENRVRLLGEVLDAVRSVWPESKPLSVRVTAEDYEPGGNSPEDVAALLNLVKDKGIDCINVSSGGLTPIVPKVFPGYQIPYAETIKRATGLPIVAGGLITEAARAEEALAQGKCDLVYLGRELLRNPFFPLLASAECGEEIPWPASYERAKPRR